MVDGRGRTIAVALALLAVAQLLAPVGTAAFYASGPAYRYIIVVDGPVIQGDLEARIQALGGRDIIKLSVIPGYIATLPEDAARQLESMPGIRVYRDWVVGLVEPVDAYRLEALASGIMPPLAEPAASNPSIGADLVHSQGITGRGVIVAVLDTGIENGHPYLQRDGASVVVAEYDATGMGVNDYCGRGDIYYLLFGGGFHGTHVAGIIAGQPPVQGVAPGASLYDVIVAYEGPGYSCVITASAIIAGLDYAVKGPDGVEGTGDEADIINLSLGANAPPWIYNMLYNTSIDPLIQALENAARKALVVVAAGNEGPGPYTSNVFCSAPGVLCIGAVDDNGTPWNEDDTVAEFSSRGPEPWGRIEPLMTAPGVDVNSTLPTATGLYTYPLSGTSMAAPHAAGALALLAEGLPLIRDPQVYAKLLAETGYRGLNNTVPGRPATVYDMGGGLIRVDNAFKARLVIDEPRIHIYTGTGEIVEYNVTIRPLYPVNATLNVTISPIIEYNTLQEPPRDAITVEPSTTETVLGSPVNVTIRVNASLLQPGFYTGYLIVDDGVQPLAAALSIVVPARPQQVNATLSFEASLAVGASYGMEWSTLLVESPGYSATFDLKVSAQAVLALVLAVTPDGRIEYPVQRLTLDKQGTYVIILQPLDAYGIPETARIKATAPLQNLTLDQVASYLDSLDTRLQALEAEVAGLKQALAALNNTIGYTITMLHAINQTLTGNITPRLLAVEAGLASLDSRISTVEDSLRELANTTVQLATRVTTLQQDVKALQEETARLTGEIARINETLTRHETLLNETATSIEEIRGELAQLSQQTRLLNNTLATLQAGIDSVNQSLTILAQTLATQIQGLTQELQQAIQDINMLREAQDQLAGDLASLEQGLNQTREKITVIDETLTLLQARLDEATTTLATLSENVDTLEQLYNTASTQLEALTQRLDELTTRLEEAQDTSRLLSERLTNLEEETGETKQAVTRLQQQVEELQSRLDAAMKIIYTLTGLLAVAAAALGYRILAKS